MVLERMRLLFIALVLLVGSDALGDDTLQPIKSSSTNHSDLLEESTVLASELEEVEDILKDASDGRFFGKVKALTKKIDKLASQLTKPLRIPEGTKAEVYEEYQKLLGKVGVVLSHVKATVVKVHDALGVVIKPFKVPKEKWAALWTEIKDVHASVSAFVTKMIGFDDDKVAAPAMFSWNWQDSHIPGLRWLQNNLGMEVWRPVPDAETLQRELQNKVRSDEKTYGERDLKIRVEATGKSYFHTNPATAIKWLDQYKGKQDM